MSLSAFLLLPATLDYFFLSKVAQKLEQVSAGFNNQKSNPHIISHNFNLKNIFLIIDNK